METVTQKVLDNTVISASIKEIKSINLLQETARRYGMATSEVVHNETMRGFDKKTVDDAYKQILVHDLSSKAPYPELLTSLQKRFPYLHSGELSSFLIGWLCYREV